MESNKHHIDSFLREKMQELPVEFSESHWKDAERRLDEENDDKKKPFFWLFLVGILLIGLGTVAIKKMTTKKNIVVKTEEVQQLAPVQGENTSIASSNEQSAKQNEISAEQTDPITNQETAAYNTGSINTTRITNAEDNGTVSTNPKENTNSTVITEKATIEDNSEYYTETTKGILAQKVQAKSTTNPVTSKLKINATQQKRNAKKQATANKTKGQSNLATLSSKSTISQRQEPKAVTTSSTSQDRVGANGPAKKQLKIYKSLKEFQDLNPRYVEGLENYEYTISSKPLSQVISDSMRKLASQQGQSKTAEQSQKKFKPTNQFTKDPSGFYLLAGVAASRGYKGNSAGKAAYGLSPSLGMGYQYNFSERMSLYLSAYMSYINHLNIRETSTQVTYSFDKDSTFLSVTRKNLLQLMVPVQLAYKLTPRHSVVGGLGLNIGLNTISLYEDSKQSSATKAFGYTGGLQFLDVNTNLGYEYQLSNRVAFGLFYQQGFRDITKNNYFNNQQTDRNSRAGISMRYKFGR